MKSVFHNIKVEVIKDKIFVIQICRKKVRNCVDKVTAKELKKLREQLPFLKDADDFVINPKAKFKSH